jgi:hypothetical protein
MQTGHRPEPPPPAPRGDGPAPKESLKRARARARLQGTVLARRPSVLVGASRWNSAGGPRSGRRGPVSPYAGIPGQPRSGGAADGETSRIGAEDFPFPAAAGRRGMASISASWSRSLQAAPIRAARWDGSKPGALAS